MAERAARGLDDHAAEPHIEERDALPDDGEGRGQSASKHRAQIADGALVDEGAVLIEILEALCSSTDLIDWL